MIYSALPALIFSAGWWALHGVLPPERVSTLPCLPFLSVLQFLAPTSPKTLKERETNVIGCFNGQSETPRYFPENHAALCRFSVGGGWGGKPNVKSILASSGKEHWGLVTGGSWISIFNLFINHKMFDRQSCTHTYGCLVFLHRLLMAALLAARLAPGEHNAISWEFPFPLKN